MKIRLHTTSLVWFLLGLNSAWAGVFEYRVRIPATSRSCADEADALAQRIPGKVLSRTCRGEIETSFEGQPARLYSLGVTYSADQPLNRYTAALGGLIDYFATSSEAAAFPTFAECVQSIPEQSRKYESATGLPVLAAWCAPGSTYDSGYLLSIDGIGVPRQRLQVFHLTFGAEDPALMSEAQRLLGSQGAEITRTRNDAVLYYAPAPISVRQVHFGYFQDPRFCEAQLAEASRMLTATGSRTPPIVRCVSERGLITLAGIADGAVILYATEMPDPYYSFEECLEDRDRPRSEGAICADDPLAAHRFKLRVFKR